METNTQKELTDYMNTIETFDKDSAQDGSALHQYLIHLTNIMARCNFLMAEYKKEVRIKKMEAYHKLIASSQAQEKYYSPSLAKDYVEAQTHEPAYLFDLAERCSRLCNHTIGAIRTIVSSLKNEREFSQYQ